MERKIEKDILRIKNIVITGHTGFKGSWLTLWLHHMGANILGISSNYVSSPSHFKILKIEKIKSKNIDLKDYKKLKSNYKF